ncbi:MAG: hypothetical protein ABI905_00675 [Betaproteobacteria bacterium]
MFDTTVDLESKAEILHSLLAEPRPNDTEWFDEVLTALEQVAEYSLNPGVPVRALSRTLRAKAQTGV